MLEHYCFDNSETRVQARRFATNTVSFVQTGDVITGLAKAGVFGTMLMGCYRYNSKDGAQGQRRHHAAVVSASILILAFDYVLTEMFAEVVISFFRLASARWGIARHRVHLRRDRDFQQFKLVGRRRLVMPHSLGSLADHPGSDGFCGHRELGATQPFSM